VEAVLWRQLRIPATQLLRYLNIYFEAIVNFRIHATANSLGGGSTRISGQWQRKDRAGRSESFAHIARGIFLLSKTKVAVS
jgi:hypothetical protein